MYLWKTDVKKVGSMFLCYNKKYILFKTIIIITNYIFQCLYLINSFTKIVYCIMRLVTNVVITFFYIKTTAFLKKESKKYKNYKQQG